MSLLADTVKSRLHRARRLLNASSGPTFNSGSTGRSAPDLEVADLIDSAVNSRRAMLLTVAGGVGLAEAVGLTTMVLTEPTPLRPATTLALLTIAAAGLSWAILAVWRLLRREALMLPDRLAAALLGTFWSTVATVMAVAIALGRQRSDVAIAVGAGGLVLIVVAAAARRAWSERRRVRARLARVTGH